MNSMPGEVLKNVFFYADRDAKYYDIVEELTQPSIDLIHDTMVDLVEYSVKCEHRGNTGRPLRVIVVASGTGAEVLRLFDRFPNINIVAVDFSPPMNREFRLKFETKFPYTPFASRVTLIQEDFFGAACLPESLAISLPKDVPPCAFDAVVAGFFLNHYPIETQREFYRRASSLLHPDGVLVVAEGMRFQSEKLSEFSHDFGERWIQKQLSDPAPHLLPKYGQLGRSAKRLREKWLHHWRTAHVYAPDCPSLSGSPSISGASSVSHAEMARAAGFRNLGFPFRLWEAAILWAEK